MVSEGVDIPRLRVGVYATPARTELFFRQVIGRFIRRTPGRGEQMSWVFLPSDPRLKELAAAVEEERRHALVDDELLDEEEGREVERGTRDGDGLHALSSTGRLDDLLQTSNPGDQLGLFGGPPPVPAAEPVAVVETSYERRERLRDERAALVRELAQRSRRSYREVHAEVNRATGAPSVGAATVKQLEQRQRLASQAPLSREALEISSASRLSGVSRRRSSCRGRPPWRAASAPEARWRSSSAGSSPFHSATPAEAVCVRGVEERTRSRTSIASESRQPGSSAAKRPPSRRARKSTSRSGSGPGGAGLLEQPVALALAAQHVERAQGVDVDDRQAQRRLAAAGAGELARQLGHRTCARSPAR